VRDLFEIRSERSVEIEFVVEFVAVCGEDRVDDFQGLPVGVVGGMQSRRTGMVGSIWRA
jgi:hypothetical protein